MLLNSWVKQIQTWKREHQTPNFQKNLNKDLHGLNLYKFFSVLNECLGGDDVVTWDAGSALYCSNQGLRLNGNNQRSIGSLSQAEMGAALGIAVGVSFARNKGRVICCLGDGSLNTSIQPLSIIKYHNLPIKVFVLQNRGFLSIKNSQDKFYQGRRIGTDENDGYFFPEIRNIAETYGLAYRQISSIFPLKNQLNKILDENYPALCEVICQESQEILPAITAFKNKEGKFEQHDFANMAPFDYEQEKDNT